MNLFNLLLFPFYHFYTRSELTGHRGGDSNNWHVQTTNSLNLILNTRDIGPKIPLFYAFLQNKKRYLKQPACRLSSLPLFFRLESGHTVSSKQGKKWWSWQCTPYLKGTRLVTARLNLFRLLRIKSGFDPTKIWPRVWTKSFIEHNIFGVIVYK
jgi:hypothetical protein